MNDLVRLLRDRHAKDVFVPECKMAMAGSRVLDGWALLPTWSPWTTVGYEVKVTRSDWVRDQKFLEYRPCCHLLFVVASKGIVQKSELPDGVGLMEPIGSGSGARLITRVKAARVEPDAKKLAMLMSYVLMWRAVVGGPTVRDRDRAAHSWREFAEGRVEFKMIGSSVKGRMRTELKEAIDARRVAESRAEQLTEAAAILDELGVRLGGWRMRQDIESKLREDATTTVAALNGAIGALAKIVRRIEGQNAEVA